MISVPAGVRSKGAARPLLVASALERMESGAMPYVKVGHWVATMVAVVLLGGCLAVAAGAGAAGAIAWTNRGASSTVASPIDSVYARSTSAFQQSGVTQTGQSTQNSGAERTLTGTKGDLEVSVDMKRATDSTTDVEVTAQRSPVEWDKNFARSVLERIIKGS